MSPGRREAIPISASTSLLTTLALVVAMAAPAGAFGLRGQVIASGGTPATGMSNGTRRMLGTVGQPAIDISNGVTRNLCHGFWCFGGSRVVAVDPPGAEPAGIGLPMELSFSAPRPNPSRDHVGFELALPKEADVNLTIFDVQGRRVYTMVDRRIEAGWHQLRWDGAEGGAAGGSGIYFARLSVDGRAVAQRRIVMMR